MPFGCFPLPTRLGWTRSPCILPRCIVPVEETARTAAGEEGLLRLCCPYGIVVGTRGWGHCCGGA